MGPKMKEGYLGKWQSTWGTAWTHTIVFILMALYIFAIFSITRTLICAADPVNNQDYTKVDGFGITLIFLFLLFFDLFRGSSLLLGDLGLFYQYRWFKLTPNCLIYWTFQDDAVPGEDPKGVLDFTAGMTVELVHSDNTCFLRLFHHFCKDCLRTKSTLAITTSCRVMYLEAPSTEAAHQWYEAISEAVAGLTSSPDLDPFMIMMSWQF